MKNSILLVSIAILLAIPNVFSQNNLSVHLGPSFPTAKYAGLKRFSIGPPGTGATAGLLFTHKSKNGLGFFIETDVYYNDVAKYFKDHELAESEGDVIWEYSEYTFSKYLNIPVSTGIMYTHQEDEKFAFFGNVGFVLNFLKITNSRQKGSAADAGEWNSFDDTYKYDMSRGEGFIVGAGMQYNRVLVKLNYISSWQNDVNRHLSIRDHSNLGTITNEYTSDFEAKVNIFAVTIGYMIN